MFLSTISTEEINEIALIKKFLVGYGQKWVWPVWSCDSKINCFLRMNLWNELIFCMLVQIEESLKVISMIFGWAWSKIGVAIYS